MASATVGSAIQACQCSIGSCPAMTVARRSERSSTTSSRSSLAMGPWHCKPQSSNTSRSSLASAASRYLWVPSPRATRSSSRSLGHAGVERGFAEPAGTLGERAGEPGLADAGGPGDQDALGALEPLTVSEAGEEPAVEATTGALVDVLEVGGRVLEFGSTQQCREALGAAVSSFALDQQGEAVLERQRLRRRHGELFLERGGHAAELEAVQVGQGLMDDHRWMLLRVIGSSGVRGRGRDRAPSSRPVR